MDTGNSISSVYRNHREAVVLWGEGSRIRSYYIEQNQDSLGWTVESSQSHWRVSSRREFLRWEDQMLPSSLKHNCQDVTYDGQPLQASAAPGLTGWAKARQCLKSSVIVPHSLNSASDGNHRAEITCASCGLNHCLHNGLFIHVQNNHTYIIDLL